MFSIHSVKTLPNKFFFFFFSGRTMTEFQKPKTLSLHQAITLELQSAVSPPLFPSLGCKGEGPILSFTLLNALKSRIASLDHFFHVLQRLISPFLSHWISFYSMKPRNFPFCSVWTWGFSSFQGMFSSVLSCFLPFYRVLLFSHLFIGMPGGGFMFLEFLPTPLYKGVRSF